jgi:hypothetical protein
LINCSIHLWNLSVCMRELYFKENKPEARAGADIIAARATKIPRPLSPSPFAAALINMQKTTSSHFATFPTRSTTTT